MWTVATLATAILVPFLIGLVFARFASATYAESFSVSSRKVPLSRVVVLAVSMIAGIIASVLASVLVQLPEQTMVSVTGLVMGTAQRPRTLLAFLVSPMVFYGVYTQAKSEPDNVVALLLAFQNGFFWHAILDKAL